MKTTKMLFAATLFASAFSFTACSEGSKQNDSHEQNKAEATVYHCPMQCEGDKTYSEEGSCPVCGMDLVMVEE
jgi:protein SCO1/2